MAEDTTPDMVETNRNDRRRTAFEDLGKTAIEGQEKAGTGDAAFGKNAHDLALRQGLACRPERLDDRPWSGGAIDGNHAGQPEQEAQAW